MRGFCFTLSGLFASLFEFCLMFIKVQKLIITCFSVIFGGNEAINFKHLSLSVSGGGGVGWGVGVVGVGDLLFPLLGRLDAVDAVDAVALFLDALVVLLFFLGAILPFNESFQ